MISHKKRKPTYRKNSAMFIRASFDYWSHSAEDKIKDELWPLNLYLWIHGIGFTHKKSRSPSLMYISLILAVGFDINAILWAVESITRPGKESNKSTIAFVLISGLNVILRILFYIKRKTFMSVHQKLAVFYSSVTEKCDLNFKMNLLVVLLLNDIASMGSSIHNYIFHLIPSYNDASDQSIIAVPESQGYSTVVRGISFFLAHWSIFCPTAAASFACVCCILRNIVLKLQSNINSNKSIGSEYIRKAYTDIMHMRMLTNNEFHSVLLIDTVIVLSISFRELFEILFDFDNTSDFILSRVVFMVIAFFRFAAMCYFASGVTNAISNLKLTILQTPLDLSNVENLQFLFYLEEGYTTYKLISSISLSNSLILTAVGSILTYGILIATFDLNISSAGESDH